MKRQFLMYAIIMVTVFLQCEAQSISMDFERWGDREIQNKISETKFNLKKSLLGNGFNDADSINLTFHYRHEYEVVRHNIEDIERIKMLYRQIVIHAMLLKTVAGYSKIDRFRIYVRLAPGSYLQTDYGDPDLTGIRMRIADDEFPKRAFYGRMN